MKNTNPIPASIPAPLPAPIQRLRTQTLIVAATSLLAIIACAWWALSSPQHPSIKSTALTPPKGETVAQSQAPLDVAAFDATIWRAPEVQVAAAPQNAQRRTPPPPKLALELVAITSDADGSDASVVRRAALYDVAKNKLVMLAQGDLVNGYTLTALDANAATFTAGVHTVSLQLRKERLPLKLGRRP